MQRRSASKALERLTAWIIRWPATIYFFATFAFVLGAVVGSFLNVCIYRLPLDLSVNEPRRSFCPVVQEATPVASEHPALELAFSAGTLRELRQPHRLSLFRGRTPDRPSLPRRLASFPVANRARLLGLRFAADRRRPSSISSTSSFPDEITIGGTVAGIVASFLVPALMATDGSMDGARDSALSAALGYVRPLDRPRRRQKGLREKEDPAGCARRRLPGREKRTTPISSWAKSKDLWSDYFARESDQLILHCDEAVDRRSRLSGKRISVSLQPGQDRRRRNPARHPWTNIAASCASCRFRAKRWAAAT